MKGNFQIIIVVVFMALAVFGILVFSGAIPIGDDNKPGSLGTALLWGTVPSAALAPLLEEFNQTNASFVLKYEQKPAETFDQDLLEALATGTGPDLLFLSNDTAFRHANKIFPIPYESYPVALFKNTFAGAGEVFLTSRGILAFPLTIDPLVMYYNRSMLDAAGVIYPPASWDDLAFLVTKLTKKDESDKILKSAVALGHYANVAHAKDIVSALFMQTGNQIVAEKDGIFGSALESTLAPLGPVLQFYTDFADPAKEVYSWNRSFPNSADAFSSEDLAFYFGFASELPFLTNRNPNQNFFATALPQRAGGYKSTASRVTGVALLSSSRNFAAASAAVGILSTGNFASQFAAATGAVPARRDLLARKGAGALAPIFYDSALFAKSWLDPSKTTTDNIFRAMVDGVLSNSMKPAEAVSDAGNKLDLLLR